MTLTKLNHIQKSKLREKKGDLNTDYTDYTDWIYIVCYFVPDVFIRERTELASSPKVNLWNSIDIIRSLIHPVRFEMAKKNREGWEVQRKNEEKSEKKFWQC